MLREMERDVGLQDLSPTELDVFLAAHSVSGQGGDGVTSAEIRHHELVTGLAQATYHRALRSLLNLGLLERADGFKTRRYVVRSDLSSK